MVPTWNYAAVHAYGRVEIVEDKDALLDIVRETVRVYEQAMARPWSFEPLSAFMDRMLKQIVGFRIEIATIEGKWKLNQNHPAERRRKVVRVLEGRGDENATAIAALIRRGLEEGVGP